MRVATKRSDDVLDLINRQEIIDLQTDIDDNTDSITSLTSGGVIAKNLCGEDIIKYEQTFLEQRPEYTHI
jgi:hypothetical protein